MPAPAVNKQPGAPENRSEYGKYLALSKPTHFGVVWQYGLQAKAGDVSGAVKSTIGELIG